MCERLAWKAHQQHPAAMKLEKENLVSREHFGIV